MSNIRLIAYQDNEIKGGELLEQKIKNNHKILNKNIKLEVTDSMAIYRLSPILCEDGKNISYPYLKISDEESEIKEISEKLIKAHDFNDYANSNYVVKNEDDNKSEVKNEEDETHNEYELKKPDEEERQTRTPMDKHNLIKAFCISYDTYNNRLNLQDSNNDYDLKIENMEDKLKSLFNV